MSPMSWKNGSQLTTTASPPWPNRPRICSWFAIRLRWLTITPRGDPVEPDVYCSSARSVVTGGSGALGGGDGSCRCSTGRSPGSHPATVARGKSVSSSAGSASRRIASSPAVDAPCATGVATGTATHPARSTPRNPTTKSSDGVHSSATRSPGAQRERTRAASVSTAACSAA